MRSRKSKIVMYDEAWDTKLTKAQYDKCTHMLGLTNNPKESYRNYYNSGYEKDSDLDGLVNEGLCVVHHKGEGSGGYYYHLNEAGKEEIKKYFGNFKQV